MVQPKKILQSPLTLLGVLVVLLAVVLYFGFRPAHPSQTNSNSQATTTPGKTSAKNSTNLSLPADATLTKQSFYSSLPNTACGMRYATVDTLYYEGSQPLISKINQFSLSTAPDGSQVSKYINDQDYKIVDQNCNALSLTDLKQGDQVKAYFIENSQLEGTRVIIVIQKI